MLLELKNVSKKNFCINVNRRVYLFSNFFLKKINSFVSKHLKVIKI